MSLLGFPIYRGGTSDDGLTLTAAIAAFNADNPILDVLATRVRLKRTAPTHGGEYHGPCPLCGGNDRFMAWPQHPDGPRAWCRQCNAYGDALTWAMRLAGIDPKQRGATARFLKHNG